MASHFAEKGVTTYITPQQINFILFAIKNKQMFMPFHESEFLEDFGKTKEQVEDEIKRLKLKIDL